MEEEARRTDLDEPEKQAKVAGQTVVQTRPTLECSLRNGGVGIKASAFRAEKFDDAESDSGANVEFTQHWQRGKSERKRQSSHLPPKRS